MRILLTLLVAILLIGCKKKDTPNSPEISNLAYPDNNSECTTGEELTATTSQVEFRWQTANHTETYELRVTNITTNTTQAISTPSTSAILPLDKGAPYSWLVISKNSEVLQTVSSSTWQFYNSGFDTTYAPFPATIVEPKSGSNAFKDSNNDVTLEWSGADVENDIASYEVYFSTETPPATLVETTNANISTHKVSVTSDTVYYWKIVTIDREGNTSDSGIFDFRML
ncbi:hypothetical protein MNBD_BACTEROID03-639 [hydrothermal vent metagenome]|uniref:Fibronectin type-III domain-containing protein n=1 Tax=hydrothermal vent metagenome TaxID=652676 RepID=A0A3B0TF47_9ZZZZ